MPPDPQADATASAPTTGDQKHAVEAYLKARSSWKTATPGQTARLFAAVPPVTAWIRSASALGEALALSSGTNSARGIAVLEKEISRGDRTGLELDEFRLLDFLYGVSCSPETSVLDSWAGDSSRPERAKLARFFLAKGLHRLGHPDQASAALVGFLRDYPDDPLTPEASLLLARIDLARGDFAVAASVAADHSEWPFEARGRLAFLRGLAFAESGHDREAAEAFTAAASLDPALKREALMNQVLLVARRDRGHLATSGDAMALAQCGDVIASAEMRLQMALDLARLKDPSAIARLREVSGPDPGIRSRASLAAAELEQESGKREAAGTELAKAMQADMSRPEREEYLGIFLKDSGNASREEDSASMIAAARAFLSVHPDSPFAPDVRLKLAEALLRNGDTQGARFEFEQLAATASGGLAREALFLASRSANRAMDPASIDDSLMLLERVATLGPPDDMTWQARLQQGALKNAQNLPSEALAIYDKILSSRGLNGIAAPDPNLYSAALMAKGDTLHQIGLSDPAKEREAVEVWRSLASDQTLPRERRDQALCKAGDILLKLGDQEEALACYGSVYSTPLVSGENPIWHDRAAFDAAALFERKKGWNDAISLYRRIEAGGGPRSGEATARLSKLKLENFLWDN